MSLKDLKFQKPHDMAILKALKRTYKDAAYLGEWRLSECPKTADLLKKCYISRINHNTEPIPLNYTYWPSDIGYGFKTPVLSLIWFLRVLNIVECGNNLASIYNSVLSKLQQVEYKKRNLSLTEKEKNLLYSNMDLLSNLKLPKDKTALTKKHITYFIENINNNTEGIPF